MPGEVGMELQIIRVLFGTAFSRHPIRLPWNSAVIDLDEPTPTHPQAHTLTKLDRGRGSGRMPTPSPHSLCHTTHPEDTVDAVVVETEVGGRGNYDQQSEARHTDSVAVNCLWSLSVYVCTCVCVCVRVCVCVCACACIAYVLLIPTLGDHIISSFRGNKCWLC